MKGRILALLACACVLASSVDAATDDRQIMAQRATDAMRDSLALDVALPSNNEVMALIEQERFIELEKLAKKYQEDFSKDPKYESPLYKFYASLYLPVDLKSIDESLDASRAILKKFDKWVEKRPSYISYGARGVFQTNLGYGIRGSEYISNTPTRNIEVMKAYLQAAQVDLLLALKKNNKFVPAYLNLILVERAAGNIGQAKQITDDAAKHVPQSYYIPGAYLEALRPRWGGSYELMDAYVSSLDNVVQFNPRIFNLRADVPAEKAYTAILEKDYFTAINFYTEALSYGDRPSFLYWRARSFIEKRQYELALADYKKYAEYKKDNNEVNKWIEYMSKPGTRETENPGAPVK